MLEYVYCMYVPTIYILHFDRNQISPTYILDNFDYSVYFLRACKPTFYGVTFWLARIWLCFEFAPSARWTKYQNRAKVGPNSNSPISKKLLQQKGDDYSKDMKSRKKLKYQFCN